MSNRVKCYVKSITGIVREEFKRVFCGYRWYLTIIAIVILWYLLSLERGTDTCLLQYIGYITEMSNEARILILAGALPMAASFCDDWQNSYIRSAVIRSGSKGYITGKIISFCIIVFITNFVSMSAYSVICGIISGCGYDTICDYYLFYDVVNSNVPFMYIVILTYLYSIVNTMYAVWGYAMTALLPNKFVAVMSPLFMGMIMSEITRHGIVQFNPYKISVGNEYLGYNTPLNLLFSTIIVLVYILIAAYFFKKIVERRIRNEIV